MVQPHKMLNTSDVKPVKNFAHSFFIDSRNRALSNFTFIGFLKHNFSCFNVEKHPPRCEIVEGAVIVISRSFITSLKACLLYFV